MKGQTVGEVTVQQGGKAIATYPVKAAQSVGRLTLGVSFRQLLRSLAA
jgi:hypothetical protein